MKVLDKVKSGGRHTVTVTLPIEDNNGVISNGVLKVVYRGLSLDEGDEVEAKYKAETDPKKALTEALCNAVIEIVDDDEVVKPSPALFMGMDTYFLNRINQAIKADREGPNE